MTTLSASKVGSGADSESFIGVSCPDSHRLAVTEELEMQIHLMSILVYVGIDMDIEIVLVLYCTLTRSSVFKSHQITKRHESHHTTPSTVNHSTRAFVGGNTNPTPAMGLQPSLPALPSALIRLTDLAIGRQYTFLPHCCRPIARKLVHAHSTPPRSEIILLALVFSSIDTPNTQLLEHEKVKTGSGKTRTTHDIDETIMTEIHGTPIEDCRICPNPFRVLGPQGGNK
ncbi:hypothetical protein F4604DRAFT_1678949 [Suillus subluteus]|nr:hypothetical protein F4604DRAFT_1678949 [Suillus subluteus]